MASVVILCYALCAVSIRLLQLIYGWISDLERDVRAELNLLICETRWDIHMDPQRRSPTRTHRYARSSSAFTEVLH
ncbi:uncharacterized protein SCHCODRAFT_01039721 [Schizophyllum commune H4-8]|uniref:Expressed protein n=1 Tax=Schizophyllum commune (strain H4-8 / FGSC 9210) TaxID=578458 RepID=D8QJG7_SCHCM|nr:uncharacterized protein SCHCODRAFT_01039721 [Schizophyllum commune H4-8]KAI5886336.1 hypothetical protein SCHCODRAFT_01039721 [Schizophyllum commune H4-8]